MLGEWAGGMEPHTVCRWPLFGGHAVDTWGVSLQEEEPEGPVYVAGLCSQGRRSFGCVRVQIDKETAGHANPICHSCLFMCPRHNKKKNRASLGYRGEQKEVALSAVRRCIVVLLWRSLVMDSGDTPWGVPSPVRSYIGYS